MPEKYLFSFCTYSSDTWEQSGCCNYLKKFIHFSHADGFGSSGAAYDSKRRKTENLRGYRNKVSLLFTHFSYNRSYSVNAPKKVIAEKVKEETLSILALSTEKSYCVVGSFSPFNEKVLKSAYYFHLLTPLFKNEFVLMFFLIN
jgi:hypothetical protein